MRRDGAEPAVRSSAAWPRSPTPNRIAIEIFGLSTRTISVVRQNLFWAFFYNALGITLAVAGILNPILAAGAMLLSSVSVIVSSLRLTRPASN